MKIENLNQIILRILAILFLIGGIVRLFVNKSVFDLFWMQDLWSDHSYFIYIYRVLGAFVVLTGLMLYAISKNLKTYAHIFPLLKWGFLVIGLAMLITGFQVQLHWIFYAFDFIFCFFLAGYFHYLVGLLKNK